MVAQVSGGRILGGDGSWVRYTVTTARDRLDELVAEAVPNPREREDYVLVVPYALGASLRIRGSGVDYAADTPIYISHEVAAPAVITRYLFDLINSANDKIIF